MKIVVSEYGGQQVHPAYFGKAGGVDLLRPPPEIEHFRDFKQNCSISSHVGEGDPLAPAVAVDEEDGPHDPVGEHGGPDALCAVAEGVREDPCQPAEKPSD